MSGEVAGYVNKTELHDIQRYLSDTENIKVRGSNIIPIPKTTLEKDKLRYPLDSKFVTSALASIETVKEAHAAPPPPPRPFGSKRKFSQ
jgi:hypothetical protein